MIQADVRNFKGNEYLYELIYRKLFYGPFSVMKFRESINTENFVKICVEFDGLKND